MSTMTISSTSPGFFGRLFQDAVPSGVAMGVSTTTFKGTSRLESLLA